MAKPVISPFSGRPRTIKAAGARGETIFRVYPRELTPLRAMIADGVSLTLCLGAVAEGVLYLQTQALVPDWHWAAAIGGPFTLYPLVMRFARTLAAKQTRIEMTHQQFRVRTWFRWRNYDRQISHRFLLAPHRLAKKEQQAHQRAIEDAARRGRSIAKRPYYAESYHLIFEYLGQAQEIATIYGRDRAMAVQARLKACDDILNHEAGNNDGVAIDPEKQWGDQPGDIPASG